jgi:pimeloyl-ACP methyl ester carboxylesterase
MHNTTVVEAPSQRPTALTRSVTTAPSHNAVISKDRTAIAFDRIGNGPPVILVDAALCYRGLGPTRKLAELLAPHFTVITYDRRGRGQSGDKAPYAIEREVEDIAALLREIGGAAYLWGMSSGAVLALEAASRLGGIQKLAIYESPFIVDGSRPTTEEQWAQIGEAVGAQRPGVAVTIFLKMVGVPRFFIALMRFSPAWPKLKALAHTLPYDGTLVRDLQRGLPLPPQRWASVTAPTLVMDGSQSPAWMRNANRALSIVLPHAQYHTLEGQTHVLRPKAHARTLVQFFESHA